MTLKQLINHPYCYRAIFFVGAIQFVVLGSVEIFKATPDLIYVATYLSLAVMSLIECVYLRFVVTQNDMAGQGEHLADTPAFARYVWWFGCVVVALAILWRTFA